MDAIPIIENSSLTRQMCKKSSIEKKSRYKKKRPPIDTDEENERLQEISSKVSRVSGSLDDTGHDNKETVQEKNTMQASNVHNITNGPSIEASYCNVPGSAGNVRSSTIKLENLLNTNEERLKKDVSIGFSQFLLPQDNLNSKIGDSNGSVIRTIHEVSQLSVKDVFDIGDLERLVTDLELLVNEIINRYNLSICKTKGENIFGGQSDSNNGPLNDDTYLGNEGGNLRRMYERLYLEMFSEELSNILLSLCPRSTSTTSYENPIRDILLEFASKEQIVYTAIIAQGAKLSFDKHGMVRDGHDCGVYLHKCVSAAQELLKNVNSCEDDQKLKEGVNVLLLTILSLNTFNVFKASKMRRRFCRGVNDLLVKISKAEIKDKSYGLFYLYKLWFISLEILYHLSSIGDGKISTSSDLEYLLCFEDDDEIQILKDLGVVLDNGFSLLGGYHIDCIRDFRELIKMLHKSRGSDVELSRVETFSHINILSKFSEHMKTIFNDRECLIVADDVTNQNLHETSFYEKIVIKDRSYYINWLDLSHQSYMHATMITILTDLFRLTSDHSHVKSLLNGLFMLFPLSDPSTTFNNPRPWPMLMFQWPLFIGGMNCTQENEKLAIMKYFRLTAELGSSYAPTCHQILDRIWLFRDQGIHDFGVQLESLSDILSG